MKRFIPLVLLAIAFSLSSAAHAQSSQMPLAAKAPGKLEKRPLPGLGVIPGDDRLLQHNVVNVNGTRTELVYISAVHPNRIATPFTAPRSIDMETKGVTIERVGQSLYVALTDKGRTEPISLFVTGDGQNDPVVSLTLIPKAIPMQTVVLQLDKGSLLTSEEEVTPSNYVERLSSVLRQVALGKRPAGFSDARLPSADLMVQGLTISPRMRYSGQSWDVYAYRVRNNTSQRVEMTEEAFATSGVRAVAFFPTGLLETNGETDVYIIADKKATE